ncbi:MAG: phosphate ABC transporter substrate-binding protein PstS [Solirubrobacteraceae bacterium]
MNTNMRRLLSVAASAVLAGGVVACGDDEETPAGGGGGGTPTDAGGGGLSGDLAGAGASSQDAAQQAWIAGFQEANPDVTVTYDPVGSGGGIEQFNAEGVPFGGTDAALEGEELKAAQERCGGPDNLIEIPVYISPIAIIYNLDGVDSLQLSAETLAAVFKGDITEWSDEAIKADNPDAELPDERITVVHRSDESGTTENFAEYMSKAAASVWDFEVSGDWPVKGQEAADGTSGVVSAVTEGQSTIGYADASQAGDLGVATVKVGEDFVEPSPEAAAKILESSPESKDPGEYVATYELDRETKESGTYPIVLVSYEMACTEYDDAETADLVKGFLEYIISEEGQQASAENAGSAPLSEALRELIEPATQAIGA